MDEQALVRHRRTATLSPVPSDAGSAPSTPPESLPELRILGYLRAIYRRRLVVIATIAAAVVVTAAYTLSLPRIYQARARILIEAGAPNVVMFTPVTEERQNADYYNTQSEILRSRTLAERAIDDLGLWSHPELTGRAKLPRWRRLAAALGLSSPDSAEPASDAAAEPSSSAGAALSPPQRAAIVSAFLGRLGVSQVKQSRVTEVSFRAEDPELAAQVANAVSRAYIGQTLETRARPNVEAASSLRRLLEDQEKEVAASEEALQKYRERHDTISGGEGQDILLQKLLQLSTAATAARTVRIDKGTLLRQLRSIQNSRASLDTFPGILANSFIQSLKSELAALQRRHAQLSEQFGELHPEIVQIRGAIADAEGKLKAEVDKAAEAVRNEYLAAEAQEKSLARALEEQQREVLARDRTSIEYANLQRTAATNRQIYESLLQRSKETEVAGSVQGGNARILDLAEVPDTPIPVGSLTYALFAVIWGGGLGVGLALAFEFLDSRLRSRADVHEHLGLPCLGVAPFVRKSGELSQLGVGLPPEFAEAIRGVGAGLLASTGSADQSVLVTSATSGEGKTLVAGNLAMALARIGQRVLLVDADLHRPRAHELLAANRGPGLAEVLLGEARLSSVLQDTNVPNLWLMAAGQPSPDSSDLLGSERLPQLFEGLTEAFDWVVVDSPPVLAVADTSFVASVVTTVVLIVGANSVKREVVQAAIDRLEALNARPIGVVLNKVEATGDPDYYYSPQYVQGRQAYAGDVTRPSRV